MDRQRRPAHSPFFGHECAVVVQSSPTLNRMRRLIVSLAAAAILPTGSDGAWALSYGVTKAIDVTFSWSGETLPAEERERLFRFAGNVIVSGHCITHAAAVGTADSREGSEAVTEALARRRAHYVAGLLGNAGLRNVAPTTPPRAVLPNCGSAFNACVVVEVSMMRRGAPSCI